MSENCPVQQLLQTKDVMCDSSRRIWRDDLLLCQQVADSAQGDSVKNLVLKQ